MVFIGFMLLFIIVACIIFEGLYGWLQRVFQTIFYFLRQQYLLKLRNLQQSQSGTNYNYTYYQPPTNKANVNYAQCVQLTPFTQNDVPQTGYHGSSSEAVRKIWKGLVKTNTTTPSGLWFFVELSKASSYRTDQGAIIQFNINIHYSLVCDYYEAINNDVYQDWFNIQGYLYPDSAESLFILCELNKHLVRKDDKYIAICPNFKDTNRYYRFDFIQPQQILEGNFKS